MATENNCSGLKVLDPVQGLVDYINDIKPYHTKVVEVLVEYVYGEDLDVTILEDIHTIIDMYRPNVCVSIKDLETQLERLQAVRTELALAGDTPEYLIEQQQELIDELTQRIATAREAADCSLTYYCQRGYSLVPFGAPYGGWPIIPPSQVLTDAEYNTYPAFDVSSGSVTIPGDRTSEIRAGDQVTVVSWIEDFSDPQNIQVLPDPTTNFNKTFTVIQVVYNGGSIDHQIGPGPANYRLGNDPHTIVTLQGGFGNVPALTADQVYVAFIRLAPVEIDRVYSYSNAIVEYEPTGPDYNQTPDEGYLRRDILDVTISQLDGFGVAIPDTGKLVVRGNLLRSNIFVNDLVSVYSSTGNNGQYTISSLSYDTPNDETTIGVVERVRDNTVDGVARIDIPSNVFVVDGDYSDRFSQGYVFNVAGGSFAGTYTALSSDFVRGKTRIRTTRDIIDAGSGFDVLDVTTGFVVRGDKTSTFTTGSQLNVVSSPTNDGSYEVAVSTYDSITNETLVEVTTPINPEIGGQLFSVQMGQLKENTFGFGESGDLCAKTPEEMVRVKFDERLTFDGLGLDVYDDLIVYNMENNDTWGYELPLATNVNPNEPVIVEQPTPPVVLDPEASLNEFWFNNSLPGTSTYASALHRFNGNRWEPITTAYWLDTDTNILHYRTWTSVVDTGWVVYFAEPPGFDHVIPAVGETEIIGKETFIVEDTTLNVPQMVFTFGSLTYPITNVFDGTASGHEDHFTVSGNVLQDADGFNLSVGRRTLTVTGSGANDGTYTISNLVYMTDGDYTRIFVEENIPTAIGLGDLTINQLIVPAGDQTLINVTINGVPAEFTLDTPSQFTLLGPDYKRDDIVVASVYDRTRTETNASVGVYGGSVPHRVFHDQVTTTPNHFDNTYLLKGGNYVHRMIPQNRLEIYGFTGSPSGLIATQQPRTFAVWEVNPATNTITVNGSFSWFFTPDVIMTVMTSEGMLEDFTVIGSSELLGRTIIEVVEDVVGRPSTAQDHHFVNRQSWDVYEVDNVTDTIIIEGDFRLAFPDGHPIKMFDPDATIPGNIDVMFTVASTTYDEINGRTNIAVVEDVPNPDGHPTTAIVVPADLPTYEDVLGAVYNPVDIETYVFPTTLPELYVDGLAYTWYGPLRIDLAMAYQNNLHSAFTDGLGASNELLQVPDRYSIIETDATANTIRIHYDDPLTSLPVNLEDSFPAGTIIRIAGSQGEWEYQTNNYQYVVLSASWEEGTTGDVVITVDTDFDNLPPYVELDVISATNSGGPSSNETQLTVAGNLSGVVRSYNLDTGNTVVRFDQPIIHAWGPRNATTITRIEYSTGSPATTTFTFDTNIEDEAFTGALGFTTSTFIGGLYYDSTNANDWEEGYILREAARIDTMPEGVAETTIDENLDFGWGMTHRWAIKSTDAVNNNIIIDGDITGILDPDDTAIITGSQGNDDNYEIASFSYNGGTNETTITLTNPNLPVDPPSGLEGYFQLEDIDITGWFQYLIKEANSVTNVFTVHGDATTDVQTGAQFRVFGTQNDGLYTVSSSPTYNAIANTTDIPVTSISTDENGGWIESYRDYGIRLVFEDFVGIDIAENANAALIMTSGSLIDSFDYTYFDVGSYDEDVATVLHLYGNNF